MKRKFGMADKLGYMFGDFGNDFAFILSSMFLLKFYTDVMGVSAGTRYQRWNGGDTVSGRTICGCIHGCDDGADCG